MLCGARDLTGRGDMRSDPAGLSSRLCSCLFLMLQATRRQKRSILNLKTSALLECNPSNTSPPWAQFLYRHALLLPRPLSFPPPITIFTPSTAEHPAATPMPAAPTRPPTSRAALRRRQRSRRTTRTVKLVIGGCRRRFRIFALHCFCADAVDWHGLRLANPQRPLETAHTRVYEQR